MSCSEICMIAACEPAEVRKVVAAVARRLDASAQPLRQWRRTYKPAGGGAAEMQLLTDTLDAGGGHELRTAAPEPLTIFQFIKTRSPPVLQARRVTAVRVGAGVPHLVAALGFDLAHEALLRGGVYVQGTTRVAIFEIHRRRSAHAGGSSADAGSDEQWEPVADGAWLVEVRLSGDDVRPLCAAADEWADALAACATLQPCLQ